MARPKLRECRLAIRQRFVELDVHREQAARDIVVPTREEPLDRAAGGGSLGPRRRPANAPRSAWDEDPERLERQPANRRVAGVREGDDTQPGRRVPAHVRPEARVPATVADDPAQRQVLQRRRGRSRSPRTGARVPRRPTSTRAPAGSPRGPAASRGGTPGAGDGPSSGSSRAGNASVNPPTHRPRSRTDAHRPPIGANAPWPSIGSSSQASARRTKPAARSSGGIASRSKPAASCPSGERSRVANRRRQYSRPGHVRDDPAEDRVAEVRILEADAGRARRASRRRARNSPELVDRSPCCRSPHGSSVGRPAVIVRRCRIVIGGESAARPRRPASSGTCVADRRRRGPAAPRRAASGSSRR